MYYPLDMSIRGLFLALFAALVLLLGGIFYVMTLVVDNQADVATAELRRFESYKLADELRQSSDDLTRMARTYVVTENEAFERYFRRILAIRNGEAPRPAGYGGIYWDFVTATGDESREPGENVALIRLMERLGFTSEELALLEVAEERSNVLAALEERAMAAVKGLYPDAHGNYTFESEPDTILARQLMHGPRYHEAKARIMEPIQVFFDRVETRTAADVAVLREAGDRLVRTAIGLMIVAVALLLLGYGLIRTRVTAPVGRLAAAARRVEAGEYGDRVPVKGQDELARLSRAFNQMSGAVERDVEERRETATELAQAREDADSANRAKSAFLANMSHELRTPMNAIIGYSEMLIEELEEEGLEDYIPDIRKVHGAGRHLLALINDILDLSKIEAGRMDLYLERFEVRTMLEEAVATIQPLVSRKDNRLVIEFEGDLGAMRADLTKVRQSIFNLMSNAAKFTENGTITLAARREVRGETAELVFSVSDSGIGIPADKLDTIFEEFSQADVATTRNYGGTGLGLPISRRFCQMMGGDIEVSSSPGKGATFTMRLPAQVDALAAARGEHAETSSDAPAHEAMPPVADAATDSPLVLVVDDDSNVRELLQRRLMREGYQVAMATNGEEGMALARKLRPAAITLDIMMPSMDGWTVLRELKADPTLSSIPVIVVSIVSDREMGFTLGAADYLTKPVDRSLLLETLKRHCENTARVLVVEDDEAARTVACRTLEDAGFEVDEAENGAEGLARIAERRPSLVLLDLMMPVMDGFEFLHRLREDAGTADLPVIVLTARELSPDERAFLERSVASVFSKQATELDQVLRDVRVAIAPDSNG